MKKIVMLVVAFSLIFASAEVFAKTNHHTKKGKPPSVEELQNVTEFIDCHNIKKNAEGYGLTTFKNNKVERFKVKFVGLYPFYRGTTNSSDAEKYSELILVKLIKPFITVAGMSGSPVYFRGKDGRWKLAGGLGYGFSDNNFPINYNSNISGVTPIKYMINQRKIFGAENDDSKTSVNYYRPKPGEMVVFSIAEPNSGFGCTVTYVHKNHFWLCAHAFMHSENNKTLWLGKINIPVYSANMITTIKGKASSYKIMTEKTPLRYIGAITYDNAYAIDGVLGAPAKLINLYIRIKKPTLKDSEWQKLSVSPTIFAGEDLFDMAVSHLFSYWPNATSTVVLKSAIRISKTSVSMFSADLSSGGEKSPDVWRLIKNISELLDKDGTADWATTMPSATVNVQVFSGNRFLHLVKKELVEDTTIKDAANRHFNLLLELKNADDSKVAKLRIPFYIPKDDKQISLEIYSGDTNLNPLVPKDSPFGALLIMLGANEKPINMKTENGFVSSVKEIADHHKSLDKIYIRVTLNKQAHSQYYKFLEPTSLPPGYFIKNLNENM